VYNSYRESNERDGSRKQPHDSRWKPEEEDVEENNPRGENEDDIGRILSKREREWRRFAQGLSRQVEKDPYEALFRWSNARLRGSMPDWSDLLEQQRDMVQRQLKSLERTESRSARKVEQKAASKNQTTSRNVQQDLDTQQRLEPQQQDTVPPPRYQPSQPTQKLRQEPSVASTTPNPTTMSQESSYQNSSLTESETHRPDHPTSYADLSSSFTRKYDPISGRMIYTITQSSPTSPNVPDQEFTPLVSSRQVSAALAKSIEDLQANGKTQSSSSTAGSTSQADASVATTVPKKELPNDDIDLLLPHDVRSRMGRPRKQPSEFTPRQEIYSREQLDQSFDEILNRTTESEVVTKPVIPTEVRSMVDQGPIGEVCTQEVPEAAKKAPVEKPAFSSKITSSTPTQPENTISDHQIYALTHIFHRLQSSVAELRAAAFRSGEFDRRHGSSSDMKSWKTNFPSKAAHDEAQRLVYDKEVLMLEGFAADFSEIVKELEELNLVKDVPLPPASRLETSLERRDRLASINQDLEARTAADIGEIVSESGEDKVHPYEMGKPMACTEHLSRPFRYEVEAESLSSEPISRKPTTESAATTDNADDVASLFNGQFRIDKVISIQPGDTEPTLTTTITDRPDPSQDLPQGKSIPLSEAVTAFDDPEIALKMALPLISEGYSPAFYWTNTIVLRKVDGQSVLVRKPESRPASTSESASTRTNPVDGTTASHPETLTGNFFSPTGYVNLDARPLDKPASSPSSDPRESRSEADDYAVPPAGHQAEHLFRSLNRKARRRLRRQHVRLGSQHYTKPARPLRHLAKGILRLAKWMILLPLGAMFTLVLLGALGAWTRVMGDLIESVRARKEIEFKRKTAPQSEEASPQRRS
jgi:hypothetical protein